MHQSPGHLQELKGQPDRGESMCVLTAAVLIDLGLTWLWPCPLDVQAPALKQEELTKSTWLGHTS